MIASTLKLALRQFGVYIAATVVGIISMVLVMSAEMDIAYKALIGVIFIAFTCVLLWNSAATRGEKDFRDKNSFYKAKGFVAAFISMLPGLLVAVLYMFIAFHGWEKNNRALADTVYLLLYFMFMPYCPALSLLVAYNPALGVDMTQLAITYLKDISMPNAVTAPLFLVPVLIAILASGLGYLQGWRTQNKMRQTVEDLKKKVE